MRVNVTVSLLLVAAFVLSCKTKTTENLEEMARRSSRPEAVLVKTVKLEPSTFYHELISNGRVNSSQKAVLPFKVNGIIKELFIKNGQKVIPPSISFVKPLSLRIVNVEDDLSKIQFDIESDKSHQILTNSSLFVSRTSLTQIFPLILGTSAIVGSGGG